MDLHAPRGGVRHELRNPRGLLPRRVVVPVRVEVPPGVDQRVRPAVLGRVVHVLLLHREALTRLAATGEPAPEHLARFDPRRVAHAGRGCQVVHEGRRGHVRERPDDGGAPLRLPRPVDEHLLVPVLDRVGARPGGVHEVRTRMATVHSGLGEQRVDALGLEQRRVQVLGGLRGGRVGLHERVFVVTPVLRDPRGRGGGHDERRRLAQHVAQPGRQLVPVRDAVRRGPHDEIQTCRAGERVALLLVRHRALPLLARRRRVVLDNPSFGMADQLQSTRKIRSFRHQAQWTRLQHGGAATGHRQRRYSVRELHDGLRPDAACHWFCCCHRGCGACCQCDDQCSRHPPSRRGHPHVQSSQNLGRGGDRSDVYALTGHWSTTCRERPFRPVIV